MADFHRHRALDWRWGLWAAVPSTAGAVLGAQLALWIGDDAFRRVLSALMLAAALLAFVVQEPRPRAVPVAARPVPWALGFFAIGVYGGFVQAGVGFLLLAATSLAGLDLLRGNAIKVLCVLLFTPLALGIFALEGKVDWGAGLVLGLGSLLGAHLGVRFAVGRAERTVRLVVQLAIAACALRLWFG